MEPTAVEAEARLEPLPGIRAVLFDIYGTLFISGVGDISLAGEIDREAALRESLEAFKKNLEADGYSLPGIPSEGLEPHFLNSVQLEQEERALDGVDYPEVDIRQVWRRLLIGLKIVTESVAYGESEWIERLALDYELRVNPVWPMPGLKETLEGLRARKMKLGIVSNAQFFTPHLFNAFLKTPVEALGFTPEYCAYSFAYREAKPSTFLYETVAAAMERQDGIHPGEVLYVGNDRRNDVFPAAAVGFRTALFAGDGRSLRWREGDPIAGEVLPDRICTDLSQVLRLVDPAAATGISPRA